MSSDRPVLTHMRSKDIVFNTLAKSLGPFNESLIEEQHDYTYLNRMFGDTRLLNLKILLLLLIVSIGTALIAAFIDISAYNINYYKKMLSSQPENIYIQFLIWSSISVTFVLIGTSFGYFFTPDADGSGIPEIKAIISGVELPRFLLWKTFFLKALGLICCSVSLSIGREGPHIHLAAVIAHKCLKSKYFKSISMFKASCSQVLQAAVTSGVAAVMGTPVGATFFSIEITASYYIVHNLINSLASGIFCTILLKIYHSIYLTEDLDPSHIPNQYNLADLFLSSVLAVLTAFLGVILVKTARFFTRLRARRAILFIHKRFRYAALIAFLYSILCFLIPSLAFSAKSVFNHLISGEELSGYWGENSTVRLLLYCIVKPLATALSISVQIPFGIFLPVLDSGAALGRVIGELSPYIGGIAHSATYAAIGGAGLLASSTHSLSASLIIFELTGSIHTVIPMILAVVISCQIAKSLELNIYDVVIQSRKIPFLPAIRNDVLYNHIAKDIMEPVASICVNYTINNLKPCLALKDTTKIPLIDTNGYLIAETSSRRIKKYVAQSLEAYLNGAAPDLKDELHKWQRLPEYDEPPINTTLGVEVNAFLSAPVDFSSHTLSFNRDPISVQDTTNLSKIHYMFHMLGLMKVFVTHEYKLVGIIKRESFTTCA